MLQQEESADMTQILCDVTGRYSPAVYKDTRQLGKAMAEAGASGKQISQAAIMAEVSGFDQLLENDPSTSQADIERYVQNALIESGLSREKVLEITGAVAASLNIPCNYTEPLEMALSGNGRYVIPYSLYETEMKRFEEARYTGPEDLTTEDAQRLTALANAGIPRAQYYLAHYMRSYNMDQEQAREYLEQAAASGDPEAAAELGDYYYGKKNGSSWRKAYHLYTGYGALALDAGRRQRVTDILNSKQYAGKLRYVGLVLAVIMLLLMAFVNFALFPEQSGDFSFYGAVLVLAMTVAGGFAYHRFRPYHSLMWLPCAVSVIWMAFMLFKVF